MRFGRAWGKRGSRTAALAGVSLLAFNTALHAQPADLQPATAQPAGAVNVSVPAGSLESGLLSLGRQTNLRMLYPSNLTAGKRTAGVSGQMSPQQAVTQLLAGTGLRASFTGRNTVQVFDPSTPAAGGAMPAGAIALDTIDVQGASNPNSTLGPPPAPYAGGQVATGGQVGMLGNRSVMNTPFSQTSYTNKTIQNQQAQTVQDVLANDPSIVMNTRSSGNDYGSVQIRGFRESSENGSGRLNGLAGVPPQRAPDMDYIERVEVLRGSSALLNGMASSGAGGLGGTYNLVTKQAGDEPLAQLTTRYMSNSQLGAHIDVGQRFGDNKEFGVRFNGAFSKGDTPVTPTSAEVGSAALNLDYRGERVRVSADIAHQSNRANPKNLQAVAALPDFVPKAPDARTSLMPTWSNHREKSTVAMVRGEVDITENVTAYAAIGKLKWEYDNTGPNFPALLDKSGNIYPSGNFASHYITPLDVLSMQGGLRAMATTGPVDHALSLNLSQSRREDGWAQTQSPYTYTTNLYNPIFGPAPFLDDPGTPKKSSATRLSSVGVADTLSILNERIQFTAGIRYQEVESNNFDLSTGAKTSGYDGNAWTPALGLIMKPWENVALYANYIENLQAGTVVDRTFYANGGEVFPPYVSKQQEIGVKVDWGTVTTTLAAFQIAQPFTISIPGAGGGLPTLALGGKQTNRGIELNTYGELMQGVRLMGGITLLDARLTNTQGGLYDGNRAYGAPAIRTVLGGEWDTPFLQGLTLTGRFTYTGDQAVNNTWPDLTIPSWTTVDLGARYVFESPWNKKPVTVRFNVDNVFGNDYWSTTYFGLLFLGSPRIYRLSTTFNF